jgi:hypothetical protein
MMFGLSTKTGSEIILRKDFETIEEAYIYFAKTKQMPLENFKKIFIVVKL